MRTEKVLNLLTILVVLVRLKFHEAALSMKQFEQSIQVIRNACLPKSGADQGAVDGLRTGNFPDDNKELKCYTMCVFEMGGVLSRKKEFIEAKVKTQGELLLPVELQATAKKAWEVCSPQPLSLINGFKRGRMVTRAQTVIVRMFEAICNCTTQTAATIPGRVSNRSQSVSK